MAGPNGISRARRCSTWRLSKTVPSILSCLIAWMHPVLLHIQYYLVFLVCFADFFGIYKLHIYMHYLLLVYSTSTVVLPPSYWTVEYSSGRHIWISYSWVYGALKNPCILYIIGRRSPKKSENRHTPLLTYCRTYVQYSIYSTLPAHALYMPW